jgi:hypothetical protein
METRENSTTEKTVPTILPYPKTVSDQDRMSAKKSRKTQKRPSLTSRIASRMVTTTQRDVKSKSRVSQDTTQPTMITRREKALRSFHVKVEVAVGSINSIKGSTKRFNASQAVSNETSARLHTKVPKLSLPTTSSTGKPSHALLVSFMCLMLKIKFLDELYKNHSVISGLVTEHNYYCAAENEQDSEHSFVDKSCTNACAQLENSLPVGVKLYKVSGATIKGHPDIK